MPFDAKETNWHKTLRVRLAMAPIHIQFYRFVNHLFYWSVMSTNTGKTARIPKGRLRDEIDEQFGGYDQFQTAFTNQAKSLFGSGANFCYSFLR